MCRSCEEYDHSITRDDRDELLRLGNNLALAIAAGVRDLPTGGMRGQIANNPAEIAMSETRRSFVDAFRAWGDYLEARQK